MPILYDNSDIRLRSLFCVFGLLALLGLAACGASDQSATAETPANAGQTQPGARQSLPETESEPPAPSTEPASAPAALPSPTAPPALPTAILKPSSTSVPPEALNPSETPASATPILLATLTAVPMRDNTWQTYRNATASYTVAYPAGWIVQEQTDSGVAATTFAPAGGAPGIIVSAQVADVEPAEPSDLPNTKRCKPVVVGGIKGLRCFDIVTLRVPAPPGGQGKSYIIASTGAGIDQALYQRFLDSFTLT
jgi:hypothetical protein